MDYWFQSGNDVIGTALGFIKTQFEGKLGISTGYKLIDDIGKGFQNGQVTIIKDNGTGNTSMLFSLIYRLSYKKRIKTLLLSDKYSNTFVGLNLLKIETEMRYSYLASNMIVEEDVVKLEKECEKKAALDIPFWTRKYFEEDISYITNEIKDFMDLYGGDILDQDRIIFIDTISFENLKSIKELAEDLNVPIVVFQRNEERESPYADCQIQLSSKDVLKDGRTEYMIEIKNRELLAEGMCDLYLNHKTGFFETN